ncbi:peptidase C39 family protein [Candidatus Woesearchaeota archaeon]|nr:peptidase C39 family protein [Candidatus Woesearchaeota archaeon]
MHVYLQSTEYTTAASSLMMVLNHFNPKFLLSRENEFRIWQESANLPVRASSIYGLAVFAKRKGLNPRIVLEEKEFDFPDYRFKKYPKQDIDHAKFMSKLHHKRAVDLGILIIKREFDFEFVKRTARQNPIMLRVNAGVLRDSKATSNYIIVFKNGKEGLTIMDPIKGRSIVDMKLLEKAFETLWKKKKRDHRMIVFE